MRIAATLLCMSLAACSPQPAVNSGTMPDLDGSFDFTVLQVVNDAGEQLEFDVYLAREPDQQLRGLMYVREMPDTTGMLFIYDSDDIRSMWMKNTFIPLDMVFVRGDGTVATVIADTTPRSLRSNQSTEPVRFVLELNAGTSRRLGIGTGSRLVWEEE